MDYAEFKRNVYKAGLTIDAFSTLIDVGPNALSSYSNKTVPVPAKYAVLAALLGHIVDRKVLNAPEVLREYGFTWPGEAPENVTNIREYRDRPKR